MTFIPFVSTQLLFVFFQSWLEAANNGHIHIVKRHFQDPKTGGVNVRDSYEFTALHHAAQNNRLDVVQFLLQKQEIDVEVKTMQGDTALQLAINAGHSDVIKTFEQRQQLGVLL